MKTTVRHYDHDTDYHNVGEFLVRTYPSTGSHINWLQPRWEYMHHHPNILKIDRGSFGIWETEHEIVAVVHLEHYLGTAYFEIDRLQKTMPCTGCTDCSTVAPTTATSLRTTGSQREGTCSLRPTTKWT